MNKTITTPKSFDPSQIKKWRIVLRQTWFSGLDTFTRTAYGIDEEDAINYDKIKNYGWGVGVRLHSIKQIPGSIPKTVINSISRRFARLTAGSL